jgi:Ca-activated chloride channel family protein
MMRRKHRSKISFSSDEAARAIRPSLRQRLLWLPPLFILLGLALLIVGLARPRAGRVQTVTDSDGIAIELVVDRSSSMNARDFKIDGEPVDRLVAIKKVASQFLEGGDGLAGRFSDLIGLITFAQYADSQTPPTLDSSFVVEKLQEAEIVQNRNEDGTAIGDAIALAVEKLNALDQQQEDKVKSKVIILLTDGENTAGELDPMQAAELASTMKIRIYTIGVGTRGQAPMLVRDPFSGRTVQQMVSVTIDEETLEKIAEATGGQYFRATDTDSLENVYAAIDQLEKSNVETWQFTDFSELAVQPYDEWGSGKWGFVVPPILLLAFGFLVLGRLLEQTWLRVAS